MLLYEYGYSTAEIAKLLNIREELVRKEKSLGLRQLRETVTIALAG
jgi:DNA-directed RNA polymerase specialized sigma24 family protein